jgi:hypothetical protein
VPRCIGVCDGNRAQGRACIVGQRRKTSLDCPPNDSTFFLSIGPASATGTTDAKIFATRPGSSVRGRRIPAFGIRP